MTADKESLVLDSSASAPPFGLDEASLARVAGSLRDALRGDGIAAGDRVALWTGNYPEHLAARDAIAALGAWVVPVNPRLAHEEIDYILGASRARALCIGRGANAEDREAIFALAQRGGRALALHWLPSMDQASATAGSLPHGYGASVVFTSGTTGYPKGCLRPEQRERARGDELIASYGLGADDVQLIACPLAHSAPGIFSRAARAVGAKTWLLPSFRPPSFLAAVEATRASFAFVVPTQCERLLDWAARDSFAIDSLRALIVAGAPLPMATKRRLVDWLGPDRLWEFYGSTETGTIAVLPPAEQLSRPGAVGRPPHGVSVQVMADGKALAPGSIGELYVASPTVMLGYEEDGQPVGDRNIDGSLAITVGDLGFVDADGYVYLVDRKHDTIITGGANVYPAEVERALAACPGVQGAVVFGIDDPNWGQIVSAVVCMKGVDGKLYERDSNAFESAAAALVESLRAHLAAYKLPRALTFTTLANLPLGSSGKPLRRLARTEFAARLTRIDGDRG